MLNIVTGSPLAEKNEFLLEKARNFIEVNGSAAGMLILHPSLTLAQKYSSLLGFKSILGLNSHTFKSLSYRIIEKNSFTLEPLKVGSSFVTDLALQKVIENIKSKDAQFDSNDNKLLKILDNWDTTKNKSSLHQAITELFRANIEFNDLLNYAENRCNTDNDIILTAIALVMRAYTTILRENNFFDESEAELIANKFLSNSKPNKGNLFHNQNFAENSLEHPKLLIVDNFIRFSESQFELLKTIIQRADETYVSLTYEAEKSNTFYYQHSSAMFEKLSRIQKPKVIQIKSLRKSISPDFIKLENNLSNENLEISSDNQLSYEDIELICGESEYDEINRVSAQILKLHFKNGIPLNKIAIFYRAANPYADIIPTVLMQNGIDSIYHKSITLNKQQGFQWLLRFIDQIKLYKQQRTFTALETDNFLSFISSQLTSCFVTRFASKALDLQPINHVSNLQGVKTANKISQLGLFGYNYLEKVIDSTDKSNNFVNSNREKLTNSDILFIRSLIDIFHQLLQANSDLIIELINLSASFLEPIKQVGRVIEDVFNVYQKLAQTQKTKQFISFLNFLKISSEDISFNSKQKQGGVYVDNILSQNVPANIQVAFVVGLEQGKFPVSAQTSPYISDSMREQLASEFQLDTQQNHRKFEDMLFFMSLFKPTQKLYLCKSDFQLNGDKNNTSIFLRLPAFSQLLRNPKIFHPENVFLPEFWKRYYVRHATNQLRKFSLSERTAKNMKSAEFLKDDTDVKMLIERNSLEVLEEDMEESANVNKFSGPKIQTKRTTPLSTFTKKHIYKSVSSDSFVLSPSALSDYPTCPYKFWLQKICKIKEIERFKLQAKDFGTLFHSVMEFFVKEDALISKENSDWKKQKNKLIDKCIAYANQYFDDNYHVFRDTYQINEFNKNLHELKDFLNVEFDRRYNCKISAASVELGFGISYDKSKKTEILPAGFIASKPDTFLEIKTSDQSVLKIRGYIDLVDKYIINEKEHFIVIDYKKTNMFDRFNNKINWFKKSDLWRELLTSGIAENVKLHNFLANDFDLQLPIYIMALKEVFNKKNVDASFYYHLFSAKKAGVITESYPEIASKKGQSKLALLTLDEINHALEKTKSTIVYFFNLMKDGYFPISVFMKSMFDSPCNFCPYSQICRIKL